MNDRRLEIFLAILEAGSFSAAAKKLLVSQPTVSNHLRALEQDLGAVLIYRRPGGMQPTEAGEVLARYARELVQLTAEARSAVQAASCNGLGVLNIGASTTVGNYFVPPLLQVFRRRFPSVEVALHVGNQEMTARSVMAGSCTLAFLAGRTTESGLTQIPVAREQLVLVAHKGHRLLGRRLHATDLSSELFLLRESGSSDRRSQEAALDLWELPTAQSTQLGSTEAIKCSMETGQGVTLMSRAAIQRELADGSLGVLHVEPPPPPRWIYAVHRSDHELTPTEDAFVALMRRHSSPPSRRPRSPVEVSS